MKQRILVPVLAVLATGLFTGNSSAQGAARKHLVIVHSSDNTGQGVVTVDRGELRPYGLDSAGPAECSNAVCGASYPVGTRVTLTAVAAPGSTFAGWSGECSGTSATCVVRLDRSRDVMVHFSR